MKNLGIFLFLICINFGCTKKKTETSTELQVGVSKAVINPPIGSFIAGDKQNRTFTGVLDSLYAKAVVFYDGEKSMALVTLDCIGLLYQDLQKIRERTAELEFDIPFSPENIVISSTHTHSGPDVVGLWGKDFSETGVDSIYMEFLVHTVAEQIHKASKNLQETSVRYGQNEFGEKWVANICKEEIDRSVTVLQFLDNDQKNIVTLTNFACHPTYMDAVFSEVSADYLAGFYKEMESQWGGEHLFLQGAIGGWIQPTDKEGGYQKALQRGNELALAATAALLESKTLSDIKIRFRSKTVFFPVMNEAWKQLSAGGIIVGREVTDVIESEVVWFSIGEATFASHPGETAPIYSLNTKELMPNGPKFVLGLSQDALGYIVKPSYFEDQNLPHAPYLTRMSLGKQTGEVLMDTLKELSKENITAK
jgi:hypothetical protein